MWPFSQLGSQTAQPPGSHPKASQVATHGQQVFSLGGGLLLYWRAVGVFYSPSRQGGLIICLYIVVLNTAIYHQQFNLTLVTCLLTVEWSNSSFSNNSILHKLFVCTELRCRNVLFDLLTGPCQVLPPWARVNLGAMAMKGYSAFPKAPVLLKPHHQIV